MHIPVVILGAGPAGCSCAIHLLRRGIVPLIVERDPYPRFHIGESLTGDLGRLLRDLDLGDRLDRDPNPHKYGVNVFGPRGHESWHVPVMGRTEDGELVPERTWQVRRSRFDQMLLDVALERGADLLRGQALAPLRDGNGGVRGLRVRTDEGRELDLETEVLLDCSGQATFLSHHGVTGPKYLGNYDRQIAVFTHVTGAHLEDDPRQSLRPGNTLIFYQKKFHWAWVIPIEPDVTSVGIVVPGDTFRDRGESKMDFVKREIRELNPGLTQRMEGVETVEPARAIVNYSYQIQHFCGKGFICVGDAHRFVDPIFSFGVNVAMREAEFAAAAIERYLAGEDRELPNPFRRHLFQVEHAVDIAEDVIDFFWEQPLAFAYYLHDRFRGSLIDTFAGRIYYGRSNEGVDECRRALGRDRRYDDEALVSQPIGSRFHPERAALWERRPFEEIER